MFTRRYLLAAGKSVAPFAGRLKPFSIGGLILTVVLLFGFQAQTILAQPAVIVLIAIPLLVQTYGIFISSPASARAGWGCRIKSPHRPA